MKNNSIYKKNKSVEATDLIKTITPSDASSKAKTVSSVNMLEYISKTEIFDIFNKVDLIIEDLDFTIKKQAKEFIDLFKATLDKKELDLKDVPPLFIGENTSDSLTIEWILPYRRIGFDFESDEKNSFYYLVKNKDSEFNTESKKLNKFNYQEIINKSIDMVIS